MYIVTNLEEAIKSLRLTVDSLNVDHPSKDVFAYADNNISAAMDNLNAAKSIIEKVLRPQDVNPVIDIHGNKKWYKDGKLHREDGPAIEYVNGDKRWYLHGKFNRSPCRH